MGIYKILDSVPESDYKKIYNFLKNHWKANHALVLSKELLDFQHLDKDKGCYHFIVAENTITGEIDSLTGYIPTWQYDKELYENGDYWGAIWKTREDVKNDEIGLTGTDVFIRLFKLPNFQSEAGIGLSNDAKKACKAFRYKFGFMNQYYIFNNSKKKYNIADHVTEDAFLDPSIQKMAGWELKWIDFDQLDNNELKPYYHPIKSIEFLRNRYQKHPIYHYDCLGLYREKLLRAALITRTIEINGSKVLRIVDAFGKLDGHIYNSMQVILREGDYEYVDFLNYGIDNSAFKEMGFRELDFDNDSLILPGYFEPFEKKNVRLTIVHKDKYDNYVGFKGDADQDRPNII